MTPEEQKIMDKVNRMLGYDPVGMLDLLHILSHPDVIEDTKKYIASKDLAVHREIRHNICSCGWEGDSYVTHFFDTRPRHPRTSANVWGGKA